MDKSLKPSQSIANAADSNNALTAFKGAIRAMIEESPEILTGILGTILPPALIPIRLFHATAKGQFLRQLMVELEKFREKGQIKEDYLKSEQAWACFSDLLDYIDKTSPDPKRHEAIRTAFLKILKQGATGKDSPHAQQLLRVICELSAGEIVVLATIYKMGTADVMSSAHTWQVNVANASGLLRSELVAAIESTLMTKRLVLPRGADNDVIPLWGQRNRLTNLGVEVCEYIRLVE